jgi:hypothetical protein
MKNQIFIIHGGNAFSSYDDFLSDFQAKEASLEGLRSKDWKQSLGDRLGENFDVLNPRMPNSQNAKYFEWKIWFEKLIPLMNESVILIGHSLGGIFLAKYLSEEGFSKRVRATIFIAAPFSTPTQQPLGDFVLTEGLARITERGGETFFFHSTDDPVVPYSNMLSYETVLPRAYFKTFSGREHFCEETFPELEALLKDLTK